MAYTPRVTTFDLIAQHKGKAEDLLTQCAGAREAADEAYRTFDDVSKATMYETRANTLATLALVELQKVAMLQS